MHRLVAKDAGGGPGEIAAGLEQGAAKRSTSVWVFNVSIGKL